MKRSPAFSGTVARFGSMAARHPSGIPGVVPLLSFGGGNHDGNQTRLVPHGIPYMYVKTPGTRSVLLTLLYNRTIQYYPSIP